MSKVISRTGILFSLWLCLSGSSAALSSAKTYPGDARWPASSEWSTLNATINGNLLVGRPPGHVCYPPWYDAAACAALPTNLASAAWNRENPTSVGVPWWTGGVCQPTLNGTMGAAGGCAQGNYPLYVVRAMNAEHVSLGIRFASKHNLRLTVKNTGHDFLGRNVGFGSLEIWTHNLLGKSFTDSWKPTVGPAPARPQSALTYGSGEIWGDLRAAGLAIGKVMVTGAEMTVGAGGGWIQGGGHGPLSNAYGLGVDNVLEHEVVLPNGDIVIANEHSHPDLFWALRGGGGSTWGVLTKITVKTYPKPTMNGVYISITPKSGVAGDSSFLEAVTTWLQFSGNITSFGLSGYPDMHPTSYAGVFNAPNKDSYAISTFVEPLLAKVRESGGSGVDVMSFPLYDQPVGNPEASRMSMSMASRLVGVEGFANRDRLKSVVATLLATKNVLVQPFPVAGGQVAKNRHLDVSVNSAWRDAVVHFIVVAFQPASLTDPVDAIKAAYVELGDKQLPALDSISVRSANYVNEANALEGGWQHSFFGSSYPRLLEVKAKYDPRNLFWCSVCVGSEVFSEGADGKLYKA